MTVTSGTNFSTPAHGGNLSWAAQVAGCRSGDILDFSASINPLGPPRSVLAALQGSLGQLRSYPDPQYRQLRRAVAAVHGLDPEWVVPGNGAAELLTWAGRDLAGLTLTVLMTPSFGEYQRCLTSAGGVSWAYALPSWQASGAKGLLAALAEAPQACGIIVNNPHNPTGLLWRHQDLLPLVESFGLVVVDEAFMDFVAPADQESLASLVPHYPNLVVLRSLTKFYSLPGLRLGYALAHPQRCRTWQAWRDPWPVNCLAAAAGIAALADLDFQQTTRDWLGTARPHLRTGLTTCNLQVPFPGAANFLLGYTPLSALVLQHALLTQARVLIRDCMSFPELGSHYFRVAVRTIEEQERLLEALEAVGASSAGEDQSRR